MRLRHHFNTNYVNASVPEPVGRASMGHADQSMISNFYCLTDGESRRFIDMLSIEARHAEK